MCVIKYVNNQKRLRNGFAFEMYVSIVKCHNFISHMLNHGYSDSVSLLKSCSFMNVIKLR